MMRIGPCLWKLLGALALSGVSCCSRAEPSAAEDATKHAPDTDLCAENESKSLGHPFSLERSAGGRVARCQDGVIMRWVLHEEEVEGYGRFVGVFDPTVGQVRSAVRRCGERIQEVGAYIGNCDAAQLWWTAYGEVYEKLGRHESQHVKWIRVILDCRSDAAIIRHCNKLRCGPPRFSTNIDDGQCQLDVEQP